MDLGKKGIFFMMLTILILSLFVISLTLFSGYALRKSVQGRVDSLSNFVLEVEDDLSRQIYVFGFRTILSAEQIIAETGVYISNSSVLFNEAFFNGTVNGEPKEDILGDITYDKITSKINGRAKKIGARVDFNNPYIAVTQEDAWNVKVVFSADFYAGDEGGLASWNKTLETIVYVNIGNFSDPLYAEATRGEFKGRIVRTIYEPFTPISKLASHLNGSYYVEAADAPSFLDRLEGRTSANSAGLGIESLVDLTDLPTWLAPEDKSMVDHLYFSSQNNAGCTVSGMPSWFRIDSEHLGRYGLNGTACG